MQERHCEQCGTRFPRPRKYSNAQWQVRRVCSLACYAAWRVEPMAKRLERLGVPEPTTGCTLWGGAVSTSIHGYDYGIVYNEKGKKMYAHRAAYDVSLHPYKSN